MHSTRGKLIFLEYNKEVTWIDILSIYTIQDILPTPGNVN